MCGYSSRAVQALLAAGAVNLRTINVLEFPEVRANLPRYSNLPSFPQFYMHGELIGGCDIILELLESGELKRIVAEAGQA
ncbi:Glutaredoxin-4 [compost metagenome]